MVIAYSVLAVSERLGHVRAMLQHHNLKARVYVDRERVGPWPNARRAWRDMAMQRDVEWCCLLQDDVTLTHGFPHVLERALRAVPDTAQVVTPYGKRKALEGRPRGSFVRIRDGTWGQCMVMRRTAALAFLAWESRAVKIPAPTGDDTRVALWLHETDGEAWVTCPSLVEHAGHDRSTLGHRTPLKRVATNFDPRADTIEEWVARDTPTGPGRLSKALRERYLRG